MPVRFQLLALFLWEAIPVLCSLDEVSCFSSYLHVLTQASAPGLPWSLASYFLPLVVLGIMLISSPPEAFTFNLLCFLFHLEKISIHHSPVKSSVCLTAPGSVHSQRKSCPIGVKIGTISWDQPALRGDGSQSNPLTRTPSAFLLTLILAFASSKSPQGLAYCVLATAVPFFVEHSLNKAHGCYYPPDLQ